MGAETMGRSCTRRLAVPLCGTSVVDSYTKTGTVKDPAGQASLGRTRKLGSTRSCPSVGTRRLDGCETTHPARDHVGSGDVAAGQERLQERHANASIVVHEGEVEPGTGGQVPRGQTGGNVAGTDEAHRGVVGVRGDRFRDEQRGLRIRMTTADAGGEAPGVHVRRLQKEETDGQAVALHDGHQPIVRPPRRIGGSEGDHTIGPAASGVATHHGRRDRPSLSDR